MVDTKSSKHAESIREESMRWSALKSELRKGIVGQEIIIERCLIGLLCGGHILLEGVPGLAKTTLIKALSKTLGLNCNRIQFTPDLLPSDLVGTLFYNPKKQDFETKRGPIFSNLILADEINRAPAKVQSALLEAMQEKQVTLGENEHSLDRPFLVLATQNPIEQEGTYRLPEAQLDRFMFKLLIGYPSLEEEKQIIDRVFNKQVLNTLISKDDIITAQKLISEIYVDEKVLHYIASIVAATRHPEEYNLSSLSGVIEHGASPRATLTLHLAARAHAFLRKRHFVIPDDVKLLCNDVLRHRILLTYEAEADGVKQDDVINKIIETIPAP